MSDRISEHFTWDEATTTDQRDPGTHLLVDNDPGPLQRRALEHTFAKMEELRSILVDRVVVIHSAYRSPLVNTLVGGSPRSQHMRGEAVDFHVIGLTVAEVFDRLRSTLLDYDQLIEEARTWVHVSFVEESRVPRRQALRMRVVDGVAKYEAVA